MASNNTSDHDGESENKDDRVEERHSSLKPPRYSSPSVLPSLTNSPLMTWAARWVGWEQGYVDLRCGHRVPDSGQPNVPDMNADEVFRPDCIFCDSARQVPRDIDECERRMGELDAEIFRGGEAMDAMLVEWEKQAAFKKEREEYGQGLESECTRVLEGRLCDFITGIRQLMRLTARLTAHLAYKKAQSKLPENQRDRPQKNLLEEAVMDRRANENAQRMPTGTLDSGATEFVTPARLEKLDGENDTEFVLRQRKATGFNFHQRAGKTDVTPGGGNTEWQTPANPAPSRGGFTGNRGRGGGQNHNGQSHIFAPPDTRSDIEKAVAKRRAKRESGK
ncbi:hypothetical protein LTR27_002511 [Elasticomyces elasticus]|nr:hypothetical protein LTR27_002511 [Elasticomyces elasticus]